MLIYLTGSTGFVGNAFVSSYKNNFDIINIDHKNLLSHEYPRSEKSLFLHLGWAGVLGKYKNDKEIQLSNINFAKNICIFLEKYKVSNFIGLGSQAEYQRTNDLIVETSTISPETNYGMAKVHVSNLIEEFCCTSDIDFKWLRLFDVYGPNDNAKWLLPYVIKSFLNGVTPKLSNCYQLWDYLYIEDVCQLLSIFCEDWTIPRGFYNLCSGEHIRLRTIVNLAHYLTNSTVQPSYDKLETILPSIRGSNQKMLDLNSWKPSIDMTEGLLETIKYFREN